MHKTNRIKINSTKKCIHICSESPSAATVEKIWDVLYVVQSVKDHHFAIVALELSNYASCKPSYCTKATCICLF